jgi:phosphoribosylglycinamide formyltransferase-1
MTKRRVGVLISGRGSNMGALIEAAARPDYPAEIALVLSNRPDAAGLARAAEAGIATAVVDHKHFPDKRAFEEAMTAELTGSAVDLICLAGFMRLLSPWFVESWRGRTLNIHPSLLPSFKGLDTHARAIAAGVKLHGCTVHLVTPAMDDGPIIAQAAVPVLADDTPDSLSARVLAAEHRLYPHALALVAAGRARLDGDRVLVAGEPDLRPAYLSPPIEP